MKDFNFFRPYLEVKVSKNKKISAPFKLLLVLAVAVVVGIGLLYYMQIKEMKSLQQEISVLDQTLSKPEMLRSLQEVEKLETDVYDISKKRLLLLLLEYNLDANNKVTGHFMDFLTGKVLENLYINKIMVEDNTINIEGKSLDRLVIAEFERNLRSSNKFDHILVNSIINRRYNSESKNQTEKPAVYDFNISIIEQGGMENEY